ncbi:hypothetical protein RLOC_00008439 [Lonchura striata]|uniref:Uncharacterized protein n=1 Tax=Lonchura striata TaxID=40157 RepID=A0A218UGE1_9PASE|nr:hypothetical protein RLOC_00008439 [Lonchura striata domestica]
MPRLSCRAFPRPGPRQLLPRPPVSLGRERPERVCSRTGAEPGSAAGPGPSLDLQPDRGRAWICSRTGAELGSTAGPGPSLDLQPDPRPSLDL